MNLLVRTAAYLMLACVAACGGSDADRPPSIVLVSIDTLRADHTSLYGYERETTPFLEELARESVVFERAHAPAPWTLPSHMTMLTGLHPRLHGVTQRDRALSRDIPLLAERLAERGYETVGLYFSSWVHERFGFGRGFEVFREHANADEASEHLREVLAARDPDRPLFLFVHVFDVHSVWNERPPRFPVWTYEPPPPFDGLWAPDDAGEQVDAGYDHWDGTGSPTIAPEARDALVALYDGGVRYVDDRLGDWVGQLRDDEVLDESLLMVTSDHGESLGQRAGEVRGHGGFFQEGLHVPLVVRFPGGARGGERSAAPVALVDLVPTALEAAGLPADPRLPGYSLWRDPPADRVLLAETRRVRALIQWPTKLYDRSGSALVVDLDEDPTEWSAQPVSGEGLDALRERLERALANETAGRALLTAEPLPAAEDAEHLEALEALGYVGGDG